MLAQVTSETWTLFYKAYAIAWVAYEDFHPVFGGRDETCIR